MPDTMEQTAREWLIEYWNGTYPMDQEYKRLAALLRSVQDAEGETMRAMVESNECNYRRAEYAEAACARMREALEAWWGPNDGHRQRHDPNCGICRGCRTELALATDAGAAYLKVVQAARTERAKHGDSFVGEYLRVPCQCSVCLAVRELEGK